MSNVKRRKASKGSVKSSGKSRKTTPRSYRWLFFFLIVLFIGLVCYLYYSSESRYSVTEGMDRKVLVEERHSQKSKGRQGAEKSEAHLQRPLPSEAERAFDLRNICYEKEALPELQYSCASQLIEHEGYHLSYNADYKVPNWVFYELTDRKSVV